MDEPVPMDIGRMLGDARRAGMLTQAELARRAGTSQPTIAAIEGGRRTPSLETLNRLAHPLGLQVRCELEPRYADVDRMLALGERFSVTEHLSLGGIRLDEVLAGLSWSKLAPPLVGGAVAALLQGVPVTPQRLDWLFLDDEPGVGAAAERLRRLGAEVFRRGWSRRVSRAYGRCPTGSEREERPAGRR